VENTNRLGEEGTGAPLGIGAYAAQDTEGEPVIEQADTGTALRFVSACQVCRQAGAPIRSVPGLCFRAPVQGDADFWFGRPCCCAPTL